MSHVVEMGVQVKDLDSLKKACEALGMEWVEGQTTYRWYGTSVGDYPLPEGFTAADLGKCTHAIRVPNDTRAYEVGVVIRDGKISLLMDFWSGGRGLCDKIGQTGELLEEEYSFAVARKRLAKQGYKKFSYKTNTRGNRVLVAKGKVAR